MPRRAPKSIPLGYAETNASGKTARRAPCRAAAWASSCSRARVRGTSKTTGAAWMTATRTDDMGNLPSDGSPEPSAGCSIAQRLVVARHSHPIPVGSPLAVTEVPLMPEYIVYRHGFNPLTQDPAHGLP